MGLQLIPISLIVLSAFYAGVGLLIWRRRPGLAVTPFAWVMFSVAVWSLGYGLEFLAPTLSGKILWSKIEFFGIASVAVFLFSFSAAYTGRSKLLSIRNQIFLWVAPSITLIFTWTNSFHHLIWKETTIGTLGGLSFMAADFGNWFWVHTVYSYTLVILACGFLVIEVARSPRPYNFHAGIVLLGILFPWAGSFLYLSETVLSGIDITPFSFLPMVFLMAWGILRYHLLGILPTAPAMILHKLQDGVVVTDVRKRILYLNNAAEQLLQTTADKAIGQPLGSVRAECLETVQRLIEQKKESVEQVFKLNGQNKFFDVRISHLSESEWGANSTDTSYLLLFRDIHQRKQVELNLQRREAIMGALNLASQQFLQATAWEANIPAFLERIGQAAEFGRAYVFQNYNGPDGQIFTSQCYEWTAPDIEPQINNQAFQHIPVQNIGPANWNAKLSQNQMVAVRVQEIPKSERAPFVDRGVRSIVIAPIFVEKRWWGLLGLEEYETGREWSQAELDAIQAAAEIFSASEIRTRNENILRRRQRTLNMLHEIVVSALQTSDRRSMAQTIVKNLIQLFDADGCFLSLWDAETPKIIPFAAHGLHSEAYLSLTLEPGELTLTASALADGRTLIIKDVSNTPYLSKRIAELLPFRSTLVLPLIAGEKKMGAILLAYLETHQFQPEEISLGEQAASLIALTLEKFQAVESAKKQAEESEMLRKAGAAIASTLRSEEAIDRILEQLSLVIPYDSASVQLLRDSELEIVGGRGWENPEAILGMRFPIPGDNPNTVVLETGEPYIIADAPKTYSGFRNSKSHNRIRSWLGVPLIVRGEVTGLLAIDSKKPDYFTMEHVKSTVTFADQVAITLENARLFEETQKRLRDQIILRNAGTIISSALDKNIILTRLAEQLSMAIDATSAYISEYDEKMEEYTVIAEYFSANASKEEKVSDLGITNPIIQDNDELKFLERMKSGQYGVVSHVDDPELSTTEREQMQQYGAKSILYVPLTIKDQLIGFAELWESRHKRSFSTEEINLCLLLSQQTAIAIENARLFEEVQNLALTDALTDLYNRRGLSEVGLLEFARSRRMNRAFSVIMIDIDHFKLVNDEHGHPVGDQVLQALASYLRGSTRDIDIVGRYGGEEFAFFLPGSDVNATTEMAERLRTNVENTIFETDAGDLRITISLGLAESGENTPDIETLVARADQALYIAKHKGRNRVVVGR